MQEYFKNFYQWLKQTLTPAYQSEIETYLSQAQDLVDLERRMMYIQRRGML
jgi:hypothetical protein